MPDEATPVVGADGNPTAATESTNEPVKTATNVDVDNDTPAGTTQSLEDGTKSNETTDALVGKVADAAPFEPPESVQVKVNGEIIDVSWDDLTKGYSHGAAASQKMTEANQKQQQAVQFLQMLQTNPRAVLTDPSLGLDFRAIAEEYLAEQLQYEGMSEEQQELVNTKAQLKEYEKMQSEAKTTQEATEMAALETQVTKEINEAIDGTNLPQNDFVFQRVAYYMTAVLNQNPGLPVKPSDVMDLVRDDYQSEIKQLFGGSDAETLIGLIGEDAIGKVRKFDSERMKTQQKTVPADKQGKSSRTKEKKKDKMTPTQFRKKFGV